jgi:hypothetical protein
MMLTYTATVSDILRTGKRQGPRYPGPCHILARSTSEAVVVDAGVAIDRTTTSKEKSKNMETDQCACVNESGGPTQEGCWEVVTAAFGANRCRSEDRQHRSHRYFGKLVSQ